MKKRNILKAVENQIVCPKSTQDISINLQNRQICVDKANYGPANPSLNDEQFWQKKALLFKTSIENAKTMRCANCAAFIKTEKIIYTWNIYNA
jgi:hypothetical protein